jgi:CheY-specific phosphatase CheX
MKKLVLGSLVLGSLVFSGCIAKNEKNEVIGLKGAISGAVYKPEIIADFYEVAAKGVVTFMTKEQIEAAKLDKLDAVIRYAYSVTKEGNKVVRENVALDSSQNISF